MKTLETIVETVSLCGKQNLPMRGNDDTNRLEKCDIEEHWEFQGIVKEQSQWW